MRRALAAACAAAALLTAGCGSDDGARQQVVVLAAASLTDVLAELVPVYERAHPDVRVVVSTGGSSTLAQQVVGGAPADLLVTASAATMAVVVEAGENDGPPVVVARNRLELAVPPGNPGRVRGLADLARPELAVALCAAQVPCGAAAVTALERAGVRAAPDTLEQDVRAVLAKVRLGEVDAGLVYATDVRAAGDAVEGVPLPAAAAVTTDYPAAVLRGGSSAQAARDLLALLTSAEGRRVLAAAGFLPPP